MGFKRPFDGEGFLDIPFKQARQVDYSNQLSQFAESVACDNPPQRPDFSERREGCWVKYQRHETFENYKANILEDEKINSLDLSKDSDTSAPLSLTTSNFSEEDVGYRAAASLSLSPEYGEFQFPQKLPFQSNVCPSYWDRFPRKPVPLGPNHQASIPPCSRHEENFNTDGSSWLADSDCKAYDGDAKKLLGTCIIPMPDTEVSMNDGYVVGGGRTDCDCRDEGSTRCVSQHVKESREKLKKSLGYERFMDLGFDDMGEDVMNKWSEEEEHIFHAVVYSNPMSLGQNFWNHLEQVFPFRSTKEIVSYYFNVFMLQRRAAQNRSIMLNVDSDDDEFHGISRTSREIQVSKDDRDSDLVCSDEPYDRADNRRYLSEDEDEEEDDNDGSDDDSDGGDGDTTGEDSGIDYFTETPDFQSYSFRRFDAYNDMERDAASVGKDFIVQDDSCISFEFEADKMDSCPVDAHANNHGNNTASKLDGSGNEASHGYLLDLSDAKLWDARCTSPITSVDLLPTCNIIEEIFGKEPAIRSDHGGIS